MTALELALSWGTAPRLHPNGFVYVDFPEDSRERPDKSSRRLHIWPTEKIPNGQKTHHPIHDHVFDMESRIVKGAMTHKTYNFVLSKFAPPEYAIYRAVYTSRIDAILEPTGDQGHVVLLSNVTYPAGSTYGLKSDILHSSTTHGLTVTVIKKTYRVNGGKSPRIAVPLGVIPHNDAKRDANPTDYLWGWVEHGLEGLADKDISVL